MLKANPHIVRNIEAMTRYANQDSVQRDGSIRLTDECNYAQNYAQVTLNKFIVNKCFLLSYEIIQNSNNGFCYS